MSSKYPWEGYLSSVVAVLVIIFTKYVVFVPFSVVGVTKWSAMTSHELRNEKSGKEWR